MPPRRVLMGATPHDYLPTSLKKPVYKPLYNIAVMLYIVAMETELASLQVTERSKLQEIIIRKEIEYGLQD